ncbi:tRNA preQ1(34) S-adenosylmethionine ribosyltransferase-isomerase QueA [Aquabacterium fontiphilum]|jgi:S-adenosylmethionine:tRNA ribosyltransferase-isomerase|uniref:tRNA preQ1(34) S-adenosylmethionine ribosyltransferase-isomerase QueA n=1 Tax=Aquabacterium fontiphilum TaxID=450365 RepID=UPI00137686B7|nr:tRNA preQ1(34) S-adenosylmethionine ribosyltransferase-isomerase QueA [Aquabacterium fontiphilum]NBD20231.1 tRNA preQ1(34) S-adenosylmethionine ribosyltransferase-isomerase QueA [Aquabacterium fontiphilum]
MTQPSSSAAHAAPHAYTLADFDFELPEALIAQHPAPERSASRLLDGRTLPPTDRVFRDLPGLLQPGDLLVFNNTRVIKARLFGAKATGGAVEALIERVLPGTNEVWAHMRASKSPKPGALVRFADAFNAEVLGRCGPDNGLFHLRFEGDPFALLEQHGHVPLPPYITHADDEDDVRRYQTVFAKEPGAVAAPTAALHFDEGVLAGLAARGVQTAEVTLHVGAGTFQPVRTERIDEHKMHSEWFDVPQHTAERIRATRAAGGRIVAVGTTTLRALESAALHAGPDEIVQIGSRDTDIFITPGFQFKVVDLLITNFHLPKSTLMMLVSALAGYEHIRVLYQHAIRERYRFFSYGDAMLIQTTTKNNHGNPLHTAAVDPAA